MQPSKSKKILALSSILLVFIDQLSKYIVRYFGGFYICNQGIAFGIHLPVWLILTLIIGIICFIGLLITNLKFQSASWRTNSPLILILSGAISNLIDRLYNGCVIDFIDLRVWPVFNLADIFICTGVFFLIIKLNKK